MDLLSKLDAVEKKIEELVNSDEYKTLSHKNRAWAVPKPTEEEKGEWGLLEEKLADLQKDKDFYQKAILSTNAHSVKKADSTRKKYKKDLAIMDERLLLSDVAIKMWERLGFELEYVDKPTFGDFMEAAGFDGKRAMSKVNDYFRKRMQGKVEKDEIKESLSRDEWITLLDLNSHVNPLLHYPLLENDDGSLRLVLEHEVYERSARLLGKLIHKLYGPDKKVDIKDASSDSSESST